MIFPRIFFGLTAFLLGLSLGVLEGWTAMPEAQWAEFSLGRLKNAVPLTEEQTEKILSANLQALQRSLQVYPMAVEKSKMARSIRRILQDRENELKKIFQPDQWRKLQMTRLEQTLRFRTEMAVLVLQLSIEQAEHLAAIHEEALQKVITAQKHLLADKKKMIEAVAAIHQEREEEIEKVLSPEQWRTYQETRKEFPDIFHPKWGLRNPVGKRQP